MTRILLINQGHTDNLGDQAIDEVLEGFLQSKGYDVAHAAYESRVEDRFDVRADRSDIVQRVVMRMPHLMERLNRSRIRGILATTGHVDAAVIGGGELIAGHWGFNAALLAWCRELHAAGVPVFVHGVSGNYLGGINARNYTKALRMCCYVSARDHTTERIIAEQYGVRCDYAPDVVFSYTKVFPESIKQEHRRMHGLCVPVEYDRSLFEAMGITSEEGYIDYLAKQMEKDRSDLPVVVTSTIMGDVQYPHHIAEQLGAEFGIHAEARTGEDLGTFIDLLCASTRVVSARMHACILALLFGCKITPIPFREKLRVFGEEYRSVEDIRPVTDESYAGLLRLHAAIEQAIA